MTASPSAESAEHMSRLEILSSKFSIDQTIIKAKAEIRRCQDGPGTNLRIREVSTNHKIWIAALDEILDESSLVGLRSLIERLLEAFPDVAYLETIMALLREMPPAELGGEEVELSLASGMAIVRHPFPIATILVFTGIMGRAGVPLRISDRWFESRRLNRIYLQDQTKNLYRDGVASFGRGFNNMASELQRLKSSLGCDRLLCYGNSAGGYAALRCALMLRAEAVLVFSGATNITRAFVGDEMMSRYGAQEQPDLRPDFSVATYQPRTRLVYAQDNAVDARQAINFQGLPRVICEPVFGTGTHNVVVEVMRSGRYGTMLDWLLEND